MSLLSKLKQAADAKVSNDYVGGKSLLPTNIYKGNVSQFFVDEYKSGALFASLTLFIDGKEIRQRLLLTNARGENYYEYQGEKRQFDSYTLANNVCLLLTGKSLDEAKFIKGKVEDWNPDTRQMEQVTKDNVLDYNKREMLTFAIGEIKQYKQEKIGDKYEYVDEILTSNELLAVASDTGITANEILLELKPTFINKWLAANEGKVIDRTKGKKPIKKNKANEEPDASENDIPF